MTKPSPLTPPDSDLSDFGFMPLDVGRFRRSDLVTQEEPEAIVAAILLWGAAWHSQPAASLSNDDRSLAHAAGFGRAVSAFLEVKAAALRGFIECDDGRLYHPVVAEKAREAWKSKLRRMWQVECARIRKHNERKPEEKQEALSFDQWIEARASRVTDPSSHAGQTPPVTRDKPVKSRATKEAGHTRQDDDAETVTRDMDDCPADVPAMVKLNGLDHERKGMSHATDPIVPRDIASDSRGRAEKGQGEGEGEGDSNRLRSAPPIADGSEIEEEEKGASLDLMGKLELLGRTAGINLTVPSKLVAGMETLRGWMEEGIDFDAIILPIVKSRTLESPSEPVYSLRYFDAPIRKAQALKRNGHVERAPAKPLPPKQPIERPDDSDERVERFRARLKYALGDERYLERYGPGSVSIGVEDDRLLTVWFRSAAEERLATIGSDEQVMTDVGRKLGLSVRTASLK